MKFIKPVLMSFVGVMLFVTSNGCNYGFKKRIDNTLSAFTASKNATGTRPFDYWCLSRGISQLQAEQDAIRTNGVIYYAVYSTTDKKETKRFDLGYLSNDADVREIQFFRDGVMVGTQKSICREIWKTSEKYVVGFNEVCRWDNTTDPIKKYATQDLTVVLVKTNGCVIGQVPVLTDKNVWEEIKRKILSEQEWQNKFPKLYKEIYARPDMPPIWTGT